METEQKTNKKLLSIIIAMSFTVFIIGLIMISISLHRPVAPTQEVIHDRQSPTMPDDLDPDPLDPSVEKPVTDPKKLVSPQSEEECVNAWIRKSDLNQYGDLKTTVYLSGPLFNENTGEITDRLVYIYSNHPDVRAQCKK